MLIGIVIGMFIGGTLICGAVIFYTKRFESGRIKPKVKDFILYINRLAYYNQIRSGRAISWREVICKMLHQNAFLLETFIENIYKDPLRISGEFQSTIKKAVPSSSTDVIGNIYNLCIERGFIATAELIKKSATNVIYDKYDDEADSLQILLGYSFNEPFKNDVIFPIIRKWLSKFASISDLPKLGYHMDYQKLINERILEILKVDSEEHLPEHLLGLYDQLEEHSPAEKYWLERIEAALDELVSDIDIGLVAEWLKGIKNSFRSQRKNSEIRSLVLSKLVPILDKNAVLAWAPYFVAHPDLVKIFTDRIWKLYANEPLEVLANNYRDLHMFPDLSDVFDKLMREMVNNRRAYPERLIECWKILPYDSDTFRLASHYILNFYDRGIFEIISHSENIE